MLRDLVLFTALAAFGLTPFLGLAASEPSPGQGFVLSGPLVHQAENLYRVGKVWLYIAPDSSVLPSTRTLAGQRVVLMLLPETETQR